MTLSEEKLRDFEGRHVVTLSPDGKPLTFCGFYDALRADPEVRERLSSYLGELPYKAIQWETPSVTREILDDPFEFVVIDSPSLAQVNPDPTAFAEHFHEPDSVVGFSNLGGDAYLVAPTPASEYGNYSHLLAFLRSGRWAVIDRLWQRVGEVFESIVGPAPLWVSTAGMGVHWLHIRFDSRPKYYRYAPYRSTR